jgi:tRNA(His) 5'-end guanylyltransferase
MTDKTAFGDRMKAYEHNTAGHRHLPLLPVCARVDGKRFSKFTQGLARPYDARMSELMVQTTAYLVEATQAVIGYTQSDEISLVFYSDDPRSQIFMDGRIQKQTSLLAAMTTAFFIRQLDELLPEKAGQMPIFDCRTWTVPTLEEAANVLLWREQDATKNSISMAAQHYYTHAELMGCSGSDKQELLFQKGVNWNDYPSFFKRGTYVQRRTVERRFTAEELDALPPKHAARTTPDLVVSRRETQRLDLPPLGRVHNRVAALFQGAEPLVGAAEDLET